MTLCLFCGGDGSGPDHLKFCDGRQGRRIALDEAIVPPFEPLIIDGAVPETWDTSKAAAERATVSKDTQRAEVLAAIHAAGARGMTDDEIQIALDLDGNSERPRRWELWRRDAITLRRDEQGEPVRRLTRTHRHAVVWIEKAS